jgi:hypothetical protein
MGSTASGLIKKFGEASRLLCFTSLLFDGCYRGAPERRLPDWLTIFYVRPGQTFADQELLLIYTESRGPAYILIFLIAYWKPKEIYNNNNNKSNILIPLIRSK